MMSNLYFCKYFPEGVEEENFLLPDAKTQWNPSRDMTLTHVYLDLDVQLEAKKLEGTAHVTFSAIKKKLESIFLEAREFRVDRVTSQDGLPLQFKQNDRGVQIYLAEPVDRDGSGTVRLDYRVEDPRLGLYFTVPDEQYPEKLWQVWSQGQDEDNKYWFPCVDHPREKVTSEIRVTVDKPYVAVSNGVLKEKYESDKGRLVYHWTMESPHSIYLISLAIGAYTELTDHVDNIPLSFYVPEGREEEGYRSFEKTADIVRFFSDKTGISYPYPQYSQVIAQDFIFGGMENTTATTLTEMTLHDERAHLDFTSEHLVAHELAHQWFGDLVTSKSWSHSWLHEGFATYFDLLYTEHAEGEDEFYYRLLENRETYFEEHDSKYQRSIVTNVYSQPIDLFDMHLYPGSASRLHMLRRLLGEEDWWEVINLFLTRYRDSVVETVDFVRCIEEVTGDNYDWFFDQWFYKPGFPVLECSCEYQEKERILVFHLKQTQDADKKAVPFRFPLVIRLVDGNEVAQDITVQVEAREHNFYLPVDQEPDMVLVDPEDTILKRMRWKADSGKLCKQLKKAKNVLKRIEAAAELAKVGSREAVDALEEAMQQDPFWGVSARAATALGEIRTEEAMRALIGGVTAPHPKARRGIVKALGNFKDEKVLQTLRPLAEEDPSYFVEAEAIHAVARTKLEAAFELVEKALERDSFNEIIRCRALEGLAELDDDRALPLLYEHAVYGKPELVRAQALRSMGKMGKTRPHNKQILDKLSDAFQPPPGPRSFRAKLAAIQALETVNREEALPLLRRVAENELDGRLVRNARLAMRKIEKGRDKGEAVQKLEKRLEDFVEESKKLKDRLDRLEAQGSR
ncbi:MAG: HEAT repeat domain-containing protein [Deltaproteobacteria bacterium]|nr:MAG: HEAT repeat domain-containing protein [Deltaproteobacteria bacterium]